MSVEPIRIITKLGAVVLIIILFVVLWIFYQHFTGNTITGWSSMLVSLWFIGGLILFSIGVVGEYIGKIYLETKKRPRFIVSDFLNEQ